MNYRDLAGIRVSEIGFGGWGIGGADWGPTDDNASLNALHAAYDRGIIALHDTALSYGRSENLIGTAFKTSSRQGGDMHQDGGLRDRPELAAFRLYRRAADASSRDYQRRGCAPDGRSCERGIGAALGHVCTFLPADAFNGMAAGARVIEANLSMMDDRAIKCDLVGWVPFIARTPLNFGSLSGLITEETIFDEAPPSCQTAQSENPGLDQTLPRMPWRHAARPRVRP